ncbi:SelT/SelW/SelH family protein [Halorubellus salinus]|uniref:SelT/SelW/SelH family protein n=1 Tax=Halorubellus salinus TaxID=755309 RepID=UPI001D06D08C|nr:Rdx family protein [Halorubellus salinus]
MASVEIEYCVPCGHRANAIETADAILDVHADAVDAVNLVPGGGGVFEVRMDGEMVLDTDEEGYDRDAIVERIGDAVA